MSGAEIPEDDWWDGLKVGDEFPEDVEVCDAAMTLGEDRFTYCERPVHTSGQHVMTDRTGTHVAAVCAYEDAS